MAFTHLLTLLVSSITISAAPSDNSADPFSQGLSSDAKIYYPSDPTWTSDVQQRWSQWAAPSYRAAIKVTTAEDIQNVVKTANANQIPWLATANGHGTSTSYGDLKNGINIDISRFNYASYDTQTELLTVGGAASFKTVWDALQPHGKEIPTGAAPCVGALGAALGAGIGNLQGHRGLMLDSLREVNMVTSNGSLVTASETKNPELFWGVRGAGFNFGIVTTAVFNVFDATYGGNVMEGDMAFPASANASFWKVLQSFDHAALDPKLSLVAALSYDHEKDEPSIVLNSVYYGPNETLQKYIKPFLDLGPVVSHFDLVPWNELYKSLFFGADTTSCQYNQHLNVAGSGLRQTDPATYEKFFADFADFSKQYPTVNISFVASRFSSDGPLRTPDAETAYPYRDIETHLLYEIIYPDEPALDDAVDEFIVQSRNTFQPTSGYQNLTLYQNYNHGDEGPNVWFSPGKLPRLSALKREWDPEQKLSYNCPIPLELEYV